MFLYAAASNSGSRKTWYILFILLLLALNGYLFYHNISSKNENERVQAELEAVSDEKGQLQIEFNQTIRELEDLKEDITEKDSSLVQMNDLLDEQKGRIERLLSKSKVSKSELAQARAMIDNLRASSENYRHQIEQLKLANSELFEKNQGLVEDVAREVEEKEMVMAEKEETEKKMTNEKNQLVEEKSLLQNRFDRAAVLDADAVKAMAIKLKGKGKEAITDNYKKADKLKVCFDLLPNKAAQTGSQDIAVRIMAPNGITLTNPTMDSGTMPLAESDRTVKYSMMKSLKYAQKKVNHCVYWEQDEEYIGGDYSVEVYHEGYKIGESGFNLNKKIF